MGERSKILILEDETLLAWSMREVLSLVGYDGSRCGSHRK